MKDVGADVTFSLTLTFFVHVHVDQAATKLRIRKMLIWTGVAQTYAIAAAEHSGPPGARMEPITSPACVEP